MKWEQKRSILCLGGSQPVEKGLPSRRCGLLFLLSCSVTAGDVPRTRSLLVADLEPALGKSLTPDFCCR